MKDKLTQEEKRIKIAEACGMANRWHIVKHGLYFRPDAHGYTSNQNEAWTVSEEVAKKWEYKTAGYPADHVTIVRAELPDYFNDLNACQSVWETLTAIQHEQFKWHLVRVVREIQDATGKKHSVTCAPANLRTEALGRTFEAWEAGQ